VPLKGTSMFKAGGRSLTASGPSADAISRSTVSRRYAEARGSSQPPAVEGWTYSASVDYPVNSPSRPSGVPHRSRHRPGPIGGRTPAPVRYQEHHGTPRHERRRARRDALADAHRAPQPAVADTARLLLPGALSFSAAPPVSPCFGAGGIRPGMVGVTWSRRRRVGRSASRVRVSCAALRRSGDERTRKCR
jgi:hypothetical protein